MEHFDVDKECAGKATFIVKVRGNGRFGVYSSECPVKCVVAGNQTDFNYDSESGLTTFYIPVPEREMYLCQIQIHF